MGMADYIQATRVDLRTCHCLSHTVNWIDSKAMFGDEDTHVKCVCLWIGTSSSDENVRLTFEFDLCAQVHGGTVSALYRPVRRRPCHLLV